MLTRRISAIVGTLLALLTPGRNLQHCPCNRNHRSNSSDSEQSLRNTVGLPLVSLTCPIRIDFEKDMSCNQ